MDNLTHRLSLTPAANFNGGGISVFFTAIDDSGATAKDTMNIAVLPVNDPPAIATPLPVIFFAEDASHQIDLSFWRDFISDVDDSLAALSWEVFSGSHVTAQLIDTIYHFNALPDWFGNDTLSFTATDGSLETSTTMMVTVNPVNDPPQLHLPQIVFPENVTYTLNLDTVVSDIDTETANINWAIDFDSGDLFPILDSLNRILEIQSAPHFNGTDIPILFTATDDSGASVTDSTTITILPVNSPPVFIADFPPLSFQEDRNLIIPDSLWQSLVEDPDNPDSTLSSQFIQGKNISISHTVFGYRISANPNWFGSDTLSWIISDGFFSDTATVAVTIQAVNDPPIVSIPPISFPEDSSVTFDLDTLVTDVDSDTNTIAWQITVADTFSLIEKTGKVRSQARYWNANTGASQGRKFELISQNSDTLMIALDSLTHNVTITAAPNIGGLEIPVIFTATDDSAASHSDTAVVAILAVNDPPVFTAALPDTAFEEDHSLAFPFMYFFDFVDDADLADSLLTWNFSSRDSVSIMVTPKADSVIFAAPENWFGCDTISIIASDGVLSDSASLKITVQSVNDRPRISELFPDTLFIANDSTVTFQLWDFVEDVETADQQLEYQFSATPDSLIFNYNFTNGELFIAPKHPLPIGAIRFNISVTDAENAVANDSLLIFFQPPTGIGETAFAEIPREFKLMQNYPNPFNPTTQIRFGIPRATHVKIEIYNLLGEVVATLVNGRKEPGFHIVNFDAGHLSSGFYFYKLAASDFTAVRKMVLLK